MRPGAARLLAALAALAAAAGPAPAQEELFVPHADVGHTITVSADTGAASLPVTFLICETDPATAQCRTALGPTVALPVAAGATPTFTILATASGVIAFDPAANRVFVRFRGQDGVVRGATGAPLTTQ